MPFANISRAIIFVVSAIIFSSSASATNVQFTFSGSGINGSTASGSFTVDGGSLNSGYFANGYIYPSLSLTIDNIPGAGPASATFDLNDINASWFSVDSSITAFIAPYGSKNFGPPAENHYDLGQPSQPFLPSLVYQTALTYNGSAVDTITWSAASPVPEPASASLLLIAAALAALLLARR
jgi:hypothetical protein